MSELSPKLRRNAVVVKASEVGGKRLSVLVRALQLYESKESDQRCEDVLRSKQIMGKI